MFSKELEQSISNLFDEAQKSNIEYITIEHLLLMILNDFDVKESYSVFLEFMDSGHNITSSYSLGVKFFLNK